MSADDLPRVTPALLRRAEAMCPRRLAHEYESGRKLSPLGDAGFEISNRIVEDATLWHRGRVAGDEPGLAFPDPTDVSVEQIALYRAVARGYLATFPDAEVEVADLGWATEVHGVRLMGKVGIALTHTDGSHELRVLRVGRHGPLLDDVDLRFTILRVSEWAPEAFRIVALDPLALRSVEYDIDVIERLDDAREWLAARLAVIRDRARPKSTIAGSDCRHCGCIPGCPQITKLV